MRVRATVLREPTRPKWWGTAGAPRDLGLGFLVNSETRHRGSEQLSLGFLINSETRHLWGERTTKLLVGLV